MLTLSDESSIATEADGLRYHQNWVIKQNFGDHNTVETERHSEFQKAPTECRKIAGADTSAPSRHRSRSIFAIVCGPQIA